MKNKKIFKRILKAIKEECNFYPLDDWDKGWDAACDANYNTVLTIQNESNKKRNKPKWHFLEDGDYPKAEKKTKAYLCTIYDKTEKETKLALICFSRYFGFLYDHNMYEIIAWTETPPPIETQN